MYTGLGNRLLEGTNRTLCTKTQEKGAVTPQTDPDLPVSVQESLVEACVGSGLLQGWGALSAAVTAWDLSKEVAINPTRDARTYTGLGKQTLEGPNKSLCAPGPGRKGQ